MKHAGPKTRTGFVLPENTESQAGSPELFGGQGEALQDKRDVPTNTFQGRVQARQRNISNAYRRATKSDP